MGQSITEPVRFYTTLPNVADDYAVHVLHGMKILILTPLTKLWAVELKLYEYLQRITLCKFNNQMLDVEDGSQKVILVLRNISLSSQHDIDVEDT